MVLKSKNGQKVGEEEMEEKNYVPEIIISEIDGNEMQTIYKSVMKNKNISRGLNTSLKAIGRPKKISDEMVRRAYNLWNQGEIKQREIASNWGVSERTVRRHFKVIK